MGRVVVRVLLSRVGVGDGLKRGRKCRDLKKNWILASKRPEVKARGGFLRA